MTVRLLTNHRRRRGTPGPGLGAVPRRTAIRPQAAGILIVTIASMTAGCGENPYLARVQGQVTIDGTPVKAGRIQFYPERGRMAIGEIVDGTYSLDAFEDGKHAVTIEASETVDRDLPGFKPPPGASEAQINDLRGELRIETTTWIVPQRFADRRTSPLTANVVAGDNTIDFPLVSP